MNTLGEGDRDRALPANSADAVNLLHSEVMRQCEQCEGALHGALLTAWRAGSLLIDLKRQVRGKIGNVWELWLGENFNGSVRTAQRYMWLVKTVTDVSDLSGLSLRQAYIRLGFRMETKERRESVKVPSLPPRVRVTNRFLAMLPSAKAVALMTPAERALWLRDLQPAWERLKLLYDPDSA